MPADYDSEEEMIRARKGRDRSDKDRGDDDGGGGGGGWRRAKEAQQNGGGDADAADWRRSRAVLAGFVRVENEASDLGEEAKALARALRRCSRRLDRWQEAALPATAILRSRSRQASGLLYARRPSTTWDPELDGGAEDDEPAVVPVVRKIAPKGRKSLGKGKAKAEPVEDVDGDADGDADGDGDVNMEDEVVEDPDQDQDDGDGDGGGDLDEEDRELLGEVDADGDESEEDEDETMADE